MSVGIKEREIRALVALLEDDSAFVQERVTARLRELGMSAVPMVEAEAAKADARTRKRIRSVLESIRRDALLSEFAALARAPVFDLERGAFLLARTAYPTLDEHAYHRQLDDLAQAVQESLTAAASPVEIVSRFARILYGPAGLTGDFEDYYDPANSYINCVLDRRRGIPISLSAIGLFVARRVGLPFVGISMPARFLLAYENPDARILIDPCEHGKIVTPEECRDRLDRLGVAWRESHLATVAHRDIMFRMLINLITIFQQTGNGAQVDLLGRMAATIRHALPPGAHLPG